MSRRRCTLAVLALVLLAAPALAAEPPAAEPTAADPSLFADGGLFTPAPQPAAPPCHACATGFTTSPGGGAPSHWGYGGDCSSAQSNLRSQLLSATTAFCFDIDPDTIGRCSFSVVNTCTCYYQGGQYVVEGYANFGCWIYIC